MTATDLDVVAERRKRLQAWIAERYSGSQAAFVAATGINQGELSGLLKPNGKSFGEKKAEKLEAQASMPRGYLMAPISHRVDEDAPPAYLSQPVGIDVGKLADLIETVDAAVAQSRRALPARTKAKIIATLYSHDQAAAASSPQAVQAALASILASME